jgi:hypothetical protein
MQLAAGRKGWQQGGRRTGRVSVKVIYDICTRN